METLFGSDLFLIFLAVLAVFVFSYFLPVGLWVRATAAGVPVSPRDLLRMRLLRVDPRHVVDPLIMARKAGLETLSSRELEAHYLAGGNVGHVIRALVAADKAGLTLPWERAAAIDLARRDVLQAVRSAAEPKVIETPRVTATAGDGVRVAAVARLTVRTRLDRLVGGAPAETLLTRVDDEIVSAIRSSASHEAALENPDAIEATVLSRNLDVDTSFEILSVDVKVRAAQPAA